LKNILGTVDNALDIINSLDGIKYTWNELGQTTHGYPGDIVEIGVIAQQIEEFLPEIVSMHKDYRAVAYPRLVAVLIEAIKELSSKVEALENK
jgi:phage-related protein